MMRDVRVVQGREGLGFALEAGEPIRVVRERLGQHLDRDVPPQVRVRRAIHLAHAAHADLGGDFIRADTNQGQGHLA